MHKVQFVMEPILSLCLIIVELLMELEFGALGEGGEVELDLFVGIFGEWRVFVHNIIVGVGSGRWHVELLP